VADDELVGLEGRRRGLAADVVAVVHAGDVPVLREGARRRELGGVGLALGAQVVLLSGDPPSVARAAGPGKSREKNVSGSENIKSAGT
jgi:hypothetical protein